MKSRTFTAVALALVWLGTAPASAQNQSAYDATGDQTGAGDRRGDITVVQAEFNLGQDVVSLGTLVNENPNNWGPGSFITWEIYTSNETHFSVLYTSERYGLVANVYDNNLQVVCSATATYQPKYSNPYFAQWHNRCLGSPKSWAIIAGMKYVDANTRAETGDTTDRCCQVKNN